MPAPEAAPAPKFLHYLRAPETLQHTAEYRVGDALYGYVARFATSDGGKGRDAALYLLPERARWRAKVALAPV